MPRFRLCRDAVFSGSASSEKSSPVTASQCRASVARQRRSAAPSPGQDRNHRRVFEYAADGSRGDDEDFAAGCTEKKNVVIQFSRLAGACDRPGIYFFFCSCASWPERSPPRTLPVPEQIIPSRKSAATNQDYAKSALGFGLSTTSATPD